MYHTLWLHNDGVHKQTSDMWNWVHVVGTCGGMKTSYCYINLVIKELCLYELITYRT